MKQIPEMVHLMLEIYSIAFTTAYYEKKKKKKKKKQLKVSIWDLLSYTSCFNENKEENLSS